MGVFIDYISSRRISIHQGREWSVFKVITNLIALMMVAEHGGTGGQHTQALAIINYDP